MNITNILDLFQKKPCSSTLDCSKTYFLEITFDCQTKNPIANLIEGTGGGGSGGGSGGTILSCADVKACLAGTTINGTPLVFGTSILIPVSLTQDGSGSVTINVGNQSSTLNLGPTIQALQTLTSLTNPSANILVYTDEVGSSVNHSIIDNITASLAGNVLTLNVNGVSGSINLSGIMPTTDVQITSGSFNAATNILTLLESNGDIHNIDLSDFQIMLATAANGDITVTQGPLSFVIKQSAAGITYNNTISGLTATTVQQAIDALAASLGSLPVDVSLAGTVLTVQVGSNSDAIDLLSTITGVVLGNTDSVINTVAGHRIATHVAVDNVSVDINETITNLSDSTNLITYNNENGVAQTATKISSFTYSLVGNLMTLNINGQSLPIDLSTLTPTNDIQINNATWVASTNILTITETNGDVHTINLSEFSIQVTTLSNGDVELSQEGVVKTVIPKNAASITFNPAGSTLSATNVDAAIKEIDTKFEALESLVGAGHVIQGDTGSATFSMGDTIDFEYTNTVSNVTVTKVGTIITVKIPQPAAPVAVKETSYGATAPTSPQPGDRWIDTSGGLPGIDKVWNGTAWITVSSGASVTYNRVAGGGNQTIIPAKNENLSGALGSPTGSINLKSTFPSSWNSGYKLRGEFSVSLAGQYRLFVNYTNGSGGSGAGGISLYNMRTGALVANLTVFGASNFSGTTTADVTLVAGELYGVINTYNLGSSSYTNVDSASIGYDLLPVGPATGMTSIFDERVALVTGFSSGTGAITGSVEGKTSLYSAGVITVGVSGNYTVGALEYGVQGFNPFLNGTATITIRKNGTAIMTLTFAYGAFSTTVVNGFTTQALVAGDQIDFICSVPSLNLDAAGGLGIALQN